MDILLYKITEYSFNHLKIWMYNPKKLSIFSLIEIKKTCCLSKKEKFRIAIQFMIKICQKAIKVY